MNKTLVVNTMICSTETFFHNEGKQYLFIKTKIRIYNNKVLMRYL